MIKGDYDFLQNIAENNLCAKCKSPLEVAWLGSENRLFANPEAKERSLLSRLFHSFNIIGVLGFRVSRKYQLFFV